MSEELKSKFLELINRHDFVRSAQENISITETISSFMQAAYDMAKADEWVSISEYPKNNPVVLRWHKIYKCALPVYYKPGVSTVEQCDWVTGTLDHTWPDACFEPFFKPMLTPPNQ